MKQRQLDRHYRPLDHALINLDLALRTLFGPPRTTERPNPAAALPEPELTEEQRRHIARLMRVNHAGEVCAQALYQGQALTARCADNRERLKRSAQEESDHLAWCERRLEELGGRKSLFNPLWYGGSLAIGALAGLAGDRWSLGFVVETERQVETHLNGHLAQIPLQDQKTRAILDQMKRDEIQHAQTAHSAGGAELSLPIRWAMKYTARLMTQTAYWI